MDREKDIQELCKQVLDTFVSEDWDRGTVTCPFCGEESIGDDMNDIRHGANCAYLIAKDLSTNHKNNNNQCHT